MASHAGSEPKAYAHTQTHMLQQQKMEVIRFIKRNLSKMGLHCQKPGTTHTHTHTHTRKTAEIKVMHRPLTQAVIRLYYTGFRHCLSLPHDTFMLMSTDSPRLSTETLYVCM